MAKFCPTIFIDVFFDKKHVQSVYAQFTHVLNTQEFCEQHQYGSLGKTDYWYLVLVFGRAAPFVQEVLQIC